ncbi:MAG: hypothetical protein N3D78_03125 [Candidatus Aenigmarchaeota archaeon]|nr:hypothetical protein [Candidatus Aenigmarchaeota archaeon]
MNSEVQSKNNLDFKEWRGDLTNYLSGKIKSGEISYEDFSKAVKEYETLGLELQQILEYAARNSKGEDKDEIWKLYMKFSQKNAGRMVEELGKLGFALKNDKNCKNLVDDLSRQSFRILEKTRHAQRSEVQYLITRIFAANKIKIPYLLSQVFNPSYSDELFKTFIYSFLGGVLSEKQNGGEEQ